jgi:hypothetical protein
MGGAEKDDPMRDISLVLQFTGLAISICNFLFSRAAVERRLEIVVLKSRRCRKGWR